MVALPPLEPTYKLSVLREVWAPSLQPVLIGKDSISKDVLLKNQVFRGWALARVRDVRGPRGPLSVLDHLAPLTGGFPFHADGENTRRVAQPQL